MAVDTPVFTCDAAARAATLAALQEGLSSEPDLLYAYLFGSFAGSGPFHDVDVAVQYAGASLSDAVRRAGVLQARLEPAVRFPLDVVALNLRPASFRFHVFRGVPLVVRDEAALAADLERTARDYFDIEPTLKRAALEAFSA
jgi:predicted nucleotidyltransferase